MSREMYDALYTSGIPAGVGLAAFYPYDNPDGTAPRAAQLLHIDNSFGGAHPDCHIADAETGAMQWADVPGWISRCTQPQPTAYCSLGNTETLFSHMTGVTRRWYLWVARWLTPPQPLVPPVTGLPANCTVIGCQYAPGGPYDLSVITDDSWYPSGGDTMASVNVQQDWRWCRKCSVLFYPSAGGNICPAGGQHDGSQSDDYSMIYPSS